MKPQSQKSHSPKPSTPKRPRSSRPLRRTPEYYDRVITLDEDVLTALESYVLDRQKEDPGFTISDFVAEVAAKEIKRVCTSLNAIPIPAPFREVADQYGVFADRLAERVLLKFAMDPDEALIVSRRDPKSVTLNVEMDARLLGIAEKHFGVYGVDSFAELFETLVKEHVVPPREC